LPGLLGISVDPREYSDNFVNDLFLGTFYQQHLGEEYAGLATYAGERIRIRTHRGLFRPTFSEDLAGLDGTEGIGYCGDIREPVLVDSKLGEFAACFSGNIINREDLVLAFKASGHSFAWEGNGIEVITKLVAQGEDLVDGIGRMTERVRGAYSLLVLTREGLFAACCPTGHWPLVIGEKKGAVTVASDPSGFHNCGFSPVRDVEPGEIVLLRNGSVKTKGRMATNKTQICSFVWVYTNFPGAVFRGIPVTVARQRMGAVLARRDINRGFIPDVVAPIPDSGRFCAIGYAQEFVRQKNEGTVVKAPEYDEVLLKYPYAGRSYIQLTQEKRESYAHTKQLVSGEDYSGKALVVCDDSIRRGTQTQKGTIPKIRSLGFSQVHLRVANPDSLSYCPWGHTVQKGELLASRIPDAQERAAYLGVDSAEHTTVPELAEAIGLPLEMLCVDCDLPLAE
jgi:amidophosphoribosyltransferase